VHELFADEAHLLGEGGSEHEDLLVVGSGLESLLHVTAHVFNKDGTTTKINLEFPQVLQKARYQPSRASGRTRRG